jgi:formamidopyrimidine-DNA glycosylase
VPRLIPARTTPERLLQGATITALRRHGKQLAIVADSGRVLVVQLGMSGGLTVHDSPAPRPKHTHAHWTLASTHLFFTDPRRFGGLTTYPSLDHLHLHRWSRLGPDALTISASDLAPRLTTTRPIKAALLDQGVLAGVGNIYVDESLFEAGIAPTTIARTIGVGRLSTLTAALRLVLGRAVAAGGSTLRNYVDASGQPGRAQGGHAVYGRGGQECVRCRRPLRTEAIAQRTTVWCEFCQSTHCGK